jgi:hypothetical protein
MPRIVGFGGRSVAASGTLSRLDEYVFELSGQDRPKVLYLPTPAADSVTKVEGHDAYRVELVGGEVRETRIPARLLG